MLPRVTPFILEQRKKLFFTSRKCDKDLREIITILYSHSEASNPSNGDESNEGESKIMNKIAKGQLNFFIHGIGCCLSISLFSSVTMEQIQMF